MFHVSHPGHHGFIVSAVGHFFGDFNGFRISQSLDPGIFLSDCVAVAHSLGPIFCLADGFRVAHSLGPSFCLFDWLCCRLIFFNRLRVCVGIGKWIRVGFAGSLSDLNHLAVGNSVI